MAVCCSQSEMNQRQAESGIEGLRSEIRRHTEEKQADLMLLFRQLESTVSGKESELRNLFVDIVRTELTAVSVTRSILPACQLYLTSSVCFLLHARVVNSC